MQHVRRPVRSLPPPPSSGARVRNPGFKRRAVPPELYVPEQY